MKQKERMLAGQLYLVDEELAYTEGLAIERTAVEHLK